MPIEKLLDYVVFHIGIGLFFIEVTPLTGKISLCFLPPPQLPVFKFSQFMIRNICYWHIFKSGLNLQKATDYDHHTNDHQRF